MDRGEGIPWKGNYSSWLEQKGERLRQEEKTESKRQKTLKRELEWVRAGVKGRNVKQKARLGNYEKMMNEDVQFAERAENDGFGLFYGNENARTQVVNWTPAANPTEIDKTWNISGAKLFVTDTIEKWRSKFDYNNLGQRIKVTERWEETKGTSFDTLILDKTINANKIILQATRLGWINCDQFYDDKQPTIELYVDAVREYKTDIVLIFTDRKGMILPATAGDGRLVFSNVPKGEKAIITGVGSAEGKLFFAKQDVITGENAIKLDMKETPSCTCPIFTINCFSKSN